MLRTDRWFDLAWLLSLGVLSSVWCLTAAEKLGATFDEPFYVQSGLHFWRTGSFKPLLDKGTMPLPIAVNTAPLYVWERWQGRPFDPNTELDTILPVARATALVFWWLLLAYAWWAGRQLGGPWGGRLAVLLLACEPNFLANAALATTDIAVTACLLAFLVHYRRGQGGGWWKRVAIPALVFGLAILAKASALVFGVLGIAVLEIAFRLRDRKDWGRWRDRLRAAWDVLINSSFRRQVGKVAGLALVLAFVGCGSDWKPSPSFVAWSHTLPDGPVGGTMRWTAEHLCIFSNAGSALAYQIRRNFAKQDVFFMGQNYSRALWYYFPVSLSIKLTLPFLALPVLLLFLAPSTLRNWACAVAVCLLLYSLNCRVQLGTRLLLPMVGIAIVGLAAALAHGVTRAIPTWRRRVLRLVAVAVPLWMTWSAISIWPNGLCFINEMWGGPTKGYELVSGPDYDWGQGVKELLAWQQRSGPDAIDLIYYGTDPDARHYPTVLSHWFLIDPRPENLLARAQSRYLAVNVGFLYSPVGHCKELLPLVDWLGTLSPMARTSTFLIYDLSQANSHQLAGW